MLKVQLKSCFVVLLFGLAGCASSPDRQKPAPSLDKPIVEGQEGQPIPSSQTTQIPVTARELPEDEREEEAELPAVNYLLDQAQAALETDELDRAAALARRAMQINRKSTRAYLVLALVEQAKGNLTGVIQLAKQGLLYTAESTEISGQLRTLIALSR